MNEIDDGPVGRAGWAWISLLCGYSFARAVVAWPFLARYGINPSMFLVLDVGTAYPLGLAQVRIVNGFRTQDFAAVQFWVVACAISFLIPYAYLFVAGHESMPGYVTVGMAGLVVVLGTASYLRIRQRCIEVGLDPALTLVTKD